MAGLVALLVGFIRRPPPLRDLWPPGALHALGGFVASLWFVCAGIALAFPRYYQVLWGILATALCGLTIGGLPTIATAFLFLGATAIGAIGAGWTASCSRLVRPLPLTTALGLAVLVLVWNLTAFWPINRSWVWGLVLGTLTLATYRRWLPLFRQTLKALFPSRTDSVLPWGERLLCAGAFGLWLLALCFCAFPEVSHDALAMHLVIPAVVAQYGRWLFDPEQFVWALWPLGADWLFSLGYLWAGEPGVRLVSFGAWSLGAWLLYDLVRAFRSRQTALWTLLLFFSTPLTLLEVRNTFVENVLLLFLLGALACLLQVPTQGTSALQKTALFAAAACSTKWTALMALPGILAVAVLVARIGRRSLSWGTVGLCLGWLTWGLLPCWISWERTGNPFFPFFNDVFKSPLYPGKFYSAFPGRLPSPSLLWEMTFASDRFLEGYPGALGYYLLGLGLGGIVTTLVRRPPIPLMGLLVGFSYFTGVCMGSAYLRYLYPVLPCFLLSVANVLPSARPGWQAGASTMIAVGLTVANLLVMPAADWRLTQWTPSPLWSKSARKEYRVRYAPQRLLVNVINRRSPGAGVAFLGRPAGGGLHGLAHYAHWYNWQFVRELDAASTDADLMRILRKRRIDYVIIDADGFRRWTRVADFLRRHGRPIARVADCHLYAVP